MNLCLSIDEWIKKMWYTNAHTGILLGHKKEKQNLAFFVNTVDLEDIMLSGISQTKDKYCMSSLICKI